MPQVGDGSSSVPQQALRNFDQALRVCAGLGKTTKGVLRFHATIVEFLVAKAPKLALLDSGLAARLLNVSVTSLDANMHPEPSGRLIETFVLAELRKQLARSDTVPALLYWRDRSGPEVDAVLEAPDGRIVGIEVKAAATLGGSDFKWLTLLRDKLRHRFAGGFVIYAGRDPLPWGDRLAGVPLSTLWVS